MNKTRRVSIHSISSWNKKQPLVPDEGHLDLPISQNLAAAPAVEYTNGATPAWSNPGYVTSHSSEAPLVNNQASSPDFETEVSADHAPLDYGQRDLDGTAPLDPEASHPPPVDDVIIVAESDADADAENGIEAASTPIENEDLTPLPVNAIIAGKYVVQNQLHHSTERNLYRVVARQQQKCDTCGRLSPSDASNCAQCGSALSGHSPADFYLMAESFEPEGLMQDPSLMDLRLYHPNLVPVVDFFDYVPFGRPRYYALAEPRQGVRLSQLSLPRPGMQVFGWALQLADALDYLHSYGVVGAGAEADDILVQGDMASLASLQNAHVSPEEPAKRTQLQSVDLAKLAATIYEAYTGFQATMTPEGMLPMPAQVPEKVGIALRAAIEPLQGLAPAITAAQWRDQLSAALTAIAELEQPSPPVDFVSASRSDLGRMRDQNQDSFSVTEFGQSSVERPMRVGLYAVADGMGGHKGGEIASAIAVQAFAAEVMSRVVSPLIGGAGQSTTLTNEAILQGMARAVQTANERIFKARDSSQNDMGTTIVAVLIVEGKAYIINVGDSRLYFYTHEEAPVEAQSSRAAHMDATTPLKATATLEDADTRRRGETWNTTPGNYVLKQVSVDHSLVHRLVEMGQLDAEEAKVHPHRNFIYRSLGGPPPIEVDTFVRTLRPGDRILLCSDGLNSMIEDSDIDDVLRTETDPDVACQRLIELANEAGGHDNITAVIIDVNEYLPLPEHPEALSRA